MKNGDPMRAGGTRAGDTSAGKSPRRVASNRSGSRANGRMDDHDQADDRSRILAPSSRRPRTRIRAHTRARSAQLAGLHSIIVAAIAALMAVVLVVAIGMAWHWTRPQGGAGTTIDLATADASSAPGDLTRGGDAVPEPVDAHHGNSPDCPDLDCIALMVNGDMLFHERMWRYFAGANTSATDGTAFDFTELFAPMSRYLKASDISVCNFETPVSKPGGPYADYPSFNIPPEVATGVAKVGYTACTHATNHSWDQGAAGIQRLNDTLTKAGLKHTGSYTNEADSMKPMILDSPTGGGKLAVIAGTVSLNGNKPSQDWMIDRLRGKEDPRHQQDIDRAVAKAKTAREEGADLVAVAMHSVVEYIDYADDWQVSEAHALADTGAFDLIFGTGSHSAQPIENYKGTWIIYGLGNAVTVTASDPSRAVNNQGVTARIQFAGRKGQAGSWRVNRIDWLPTANMRQGLYRWCPIAADRPDGACWSDDEDARVRERIRNVIYAKGADPNVVREWEITKEPAA